jgi:hypothetical protein
MLERCAKEHFDQPGRSLRTQRCRKPKPQYILVTSDCWKVIAYHDSGGKCQNLGLVVTHPFQDLHIGSLTTPFALSAPEDLTSDAKRFQKPVIIELWP